MKKTPNSVKLQKLLDRWPDLSNICVSSRAYDISARMAIEDLIKALKRDEQIARELEEKNQLKMF